MGIVVSVVSRTFFAAVVFAVVGMTAHQTDRLIKTAKVSFYMKRVMRYSVGVIISLCCFFLYLLLNGFEISQAFEIVFMAFVTFIFVGFGVVVGYLIDIVVKIKSATKQTREINELTQS